MNILVVDDEKDQLKALCLSLRSCGFRTQATDSGIQALTMLDRTDHGIDLVITDYAMPEMNGIHLLRKIKRNHPAMPVILISAMGSARLAEDLYKNGGQVFMYKPFLVEELVGKINKITENQMK